MHSNVHWPGEDISISKLPVASKSAAAVYLEAANNHYLHKMLVTHAGVLCNFQSKMDLHLLKKLLNPKRLNTL